MLNYRAKLEPSVNQALNLPNLGLQLAQAWLNEHAEIW